MGRQGRPRGAGAPFSDNYFDDVEIILKRTISRGRVFPGLEAPPNFEEKIISGQKLRKIITYWIFNETKNFPHTNFPYIIQNEYPNFKTV